MIDVGSWLLQLLLRSLEFQLGQRRGIRWCSWELVEGVEEGEDVGL